jgi:hypothetical protein
VTEFILYRNVDTDAVASQPATARAMLAASGWFPLADEEVAALEQEEADALIAAEQAMQQQAETALGAMSAPVPEPEPEVEPVEQPTAPTKDEGQITEEND